MNICFMSKKLLHYVYENCVLIIMARPVIEFKINSIYNSLPIRISVQIGYMQYQYHESHLKYIASIAK